MTIEAVKSLVFRYFMGYWNNRRVCSAIGGIPPIELRKQYYQKQLLQPTKWDVGTVFFTIYPRSFLHEKSPIYEYTEPLIYAVHNIANYSVVFISVLVSEMLFCALSLTVRLVANNTKQHSQKASNSIYSFKQYRIFICRVSAPINCK